MSRAQYLKIIEREIVKLNKRIDMKILRGEEYLREAKEHKLLLRKVRQNLPKKSFFGDLFSFLNVSFG